MYVSCITFCMVLSTWVHTKLLYSSLDNVVALPNLQTPSFKYSQFVFAPLQKFVFAPVLNVNFCRSNFVKLHRSHMTLNPFEILLKHKRLCLLPSLKISAHLTSYNERSCYFFEVPSNWDLNIKWITTHSQQLQTPWDFGRHITYMSSTSTQNFSSVDDDHRELSLSKETDFKTEAETLDTWISLNTYPNDLKFLSHI